MQTSYIQLLADISGYRIIALASRACSPTKTACDMHTLLIERLDMIVEDIREILKWERDLFRITDAEEIEEKEELIWSSKNAFQNTWKCECRYYRDPILDLVILEYDDEELCDLRAILKEIGRDLDIWFYVGFVEYDDEY